MLWGGFWETWGGLGRLLEGSARSVFARVASEGSWRAIWEDFGSILGGFGLYFGRFFGAKSEKVALDSELKSKPKKKAIKSHASNPGESRGTLSNGVARP